jgi:2-desacetyl-2-hydroxyethyl bacteriochlorophyllide A dehydrogenase
MNAMLAVVKEKPGPGWELRQVPVPRPEAGEVLLAVRRIGICGSDLAIYDGREKDLRLPVIPGHEFAGEVVECGPPAAGSAADLPVGTRVAVNLVRNCGSCYQCRKGQGNLCLAPNLIGFHSNGGFAEYACVPARNCHLLPEGMDWEAAATIDPVTSALAAVQKAGISASDRVVVLGPGPIGLYACQLARLQGAREVFVIGTRENLLEKARELGADRTFQVGRTDLAACLPALLEATEGRGAEVVVEATGNPAALDLALGIAAKGGRIALVSIYHERTDIEPNLIVFKELRVLGSFDYRWSDFENALQLIAAGRVRTQPLITHRLPLARIMEGIESMQRRQAIKVLLEP